MDAPMSRLPNDRREHLRRRERLVAHAVAAALRGEGCQVEKARPRPGSAPGPDWIVTVDDVPTAIEVTRLLPPAYVRNARCRIARVEMGVQGFLAPAIAGVGGEVVLALAYSAGGVAARRRDRLASDTRMLASEVRQTLNRLVDREPMEIASPIPWIERAEVTLLHGPWDGFWIRQSPDAAKPDLDDFVARTIAAKAAQDVSHAARVVLAIDTEIAGPGDLRVAFGRSPVPVTWWRVYHVLGSDATLVFGE
jgi:hypothetical protein